MSNQDNEPNNLQRELQKSRTKLITQKELLVGSVTRSKLSLRDFKFLEENGLSTRKLGFSIEENYEKLVIDLGLLVEDWYQYI